MSSSNRVQKSQGEYCRTVEHSHAISAFLYKGYPTWERRCSNVMKQTNVLHLSPPGTHHRGCRSPCWILQKPNACCMLTNAQTSVNYELTCPVQRQRMQHRNSTLSFAKLIYYDQHLNFLDLAGISHWPPRFLTTGMDRQPIFWQLHGVIYAIAVLVPPTTTVQIGATSFAEGIGRRCERASVLPTPTTLSIWASQILGSVCWPRRWIRFASLFQ